jgi:hypothetical protein
MCGFFYILYDAINKYNLYVNFFQLIIKKIILFRMSVKHWFMKNRQILEGHVKFGFSLVVENMKLNCHYFEKKLHNCEFIIHPNITVFAKIIHIPYSLFFTLKHETCSGQFFISSAYRWFRFEIWLFWFVYSR